MTDNKEKYCSNCKYDAIEITDPPCNECCNAYASKFVAKTNHDMVKEMSVDELAGFLDNITKGRKHIDQLYKTVFGKASVDFDAKQSIK